MKPSKLYSTNFLTFFGYCSFLWMVVFFPLVRCKSQETEEKPQLLPRPEFEKPVKELISATLKAHKEQSNQLEFAKLFGFLDSKLDDGVKKLISDRGMIRFKKPSKEGDGSFSNIGKRPITFEVVLKDEPIMVEIPTVLRGHYFTSEKQCYYVFSPTNTIILYKSGFKWVKTIKVERLLATENLLFLDFEETKYDAGFSFGGEKKAEEIK